MDGLRYCFGAFELDANRRSLTCAGEPVRLSGKPLELLLLLARSRGETVPRAEALAALWPGAAVHENSLAVAANTVRRALMRARPGPPWIETVPRRGYRLTAPVRVAAVADAPAHARDAPPLVGRAAELRLLQGFVEDARRGAGGVAWVTGEAGIGKTALIEHLQRELAKSAPDVVVASAKCLELQVTSEPFAPFIDLTAQILAGPWREPMADALLAHCTHWCSYHPTVFAGRPAFDALARAGSTISAPVLMRQLRDALFALARHAPTVLFIEDLQHADGATADLLRVLAARVAPERLLVIGTFRGRTGAFAPRQLESLIHASDGEPSRALALAAWTEADVRELVETERAGEPSNGALARSLWEKTEGLPLFASRLLRAAVEVVSSPGSSDPPAALLEDALARAATSVTGFIRQQLLTMSEFERALLDVASVLGEEFRTSTVALVVDGDESAIEVRFEALESVHQLVAKLGEEELPGGGLTVRYRFCHALVREQLYALLPVRRRIELHGRVARALSAARSTRRGSSRGDHAYEARSQCELAYHLERSRNFAEAVVALLRAGDYCDRRFSKAEALSHYQRARALLDKTAPAEQPLFRLLTAQNSGWARLGLGDLEAALAEFRQAGEWARELQTRVSSPATRLALERGHAYLDVDWEDPVVRRPTAMLPDLAEPGVNALLAEAYFGECVALARAERIPELSAAASELLNLARGTGNPLREAEGLAWLAVAELESGAFDAARALLDACLALSRRAGHARSLEMAASAQARLHVARGEYALAETLYEELRQSAVLSGRVAQCLAELGDLDAKLGRIRAAFERHEQAVVLARSTLGNALSSAGWIYRELGAPREALELDRMTLDACPPDAPRRRRLLVYDVAADHARLGDVDSAERTLRQVQVPESLRGGLMNLQHESLAWCEIHRAAQRREALFSVASRWYRAAEAQRSRESMLRASPFLVNSAPPEIAAAHLRRELEAHRSQPMPLFGVGLFRAWELLALESGDPLEAERARAATRAVHDEIAATIDDARLRTSFRRSALGPPSRVPA